MMLDYHLSTHQFKVVTLAIHDQLVESNQLHRKGHQIMTPQFMLNCYDANHLELVMIEICSYRCQGSHKPGRIQPNHQVSGKIALHNFS